MKRHIYWNRVISLLLLVALTVPTLFRAQEVARRKAVFKALYTQADQAVLDEFSAQNHETLETRFDALMASTGLMGDAAFEEKVKSLMIRGILLGQDVILGKRNVSDTRFMKEAHALLLEFVKIDVEMQKDKDVLSGEDSFTAFAISLLWAYLDFYEAHFHEPPTVEEGIQREADIFYTEEENPLQSLDIYYPEDCKEPLPVIVDIHGGGLMYGDKSKLLEYASTLSTYGYVVVAINYRLAPQVQYDAQIQDILKAYQWVYAHIEEYGGDLNNVYLVGDSAGGQLAYYTSMVGQSEFLSELYKTELSPLKINAIGVVSGMFDMKSGPNSILLPCMLGYEYRSLPYFPYLQPQEVLDFGTLPPIFLMTEKKDFLRLATLDFADLQELTYHLF